MPKNKEKEQNNRMQIDVHPELVEILERIRKTIKEKTWDTMDKDITWKELTCILARKIKARDFNF